MARCQGSERFRPAKGLVVIVALAAVLVPGAAATTSAFSTQPPTTLASVRGYVEGFAQDGDHMVWATESGRCGRNVVLRTLSAHRSTFLDGPRGPMCEQLENAGEIQPWMALAGTRALWARESPSLSHYNYVLFTAAAGGRPEREIARMSIEGGLEDEGDALRPVPVAGHGKTLVFADINTDEGEPSGVYRVVGRHVQRVAGTRLAFSVAASGSGFSLARAVPAGCVCNTSPAWSPDGRRLAFLSGESGAATRLVVTNTDGTNRRKVLDDVSTFAWSPDGASFAATQSQKVVVVKSDGSGLRTAAPVNANSLTWSPDGSHLAYSGQQKPDTGAHLFVIPSNGGAAVDLGPTDDVPVWSPDSRRIAFTRAVGDNEHVYVATAAEAAPLDLGVASGPQWAADSVLLAVQREDGTYAVSPDGSGNRRIGPSGDLSPDWTWIAYGTRPSADPDARYQEVWIVPTSGGAPRQLAHADTIGGWGWSPDSRSIGYSRWATRDFEVVDPSFDVVDVATGLRRVSAPRTDCFPLQWSPDATRLVCLAPNESADYGGELVVVDTASRTTATVTHTEPEPARTIIETRAAGGKLLSSFEAPANVADVASAGSRFALLIGRSKTESTIEIRTSSGKPLRSVNVPRPWFDQFAMSGRWIVFRAGNTVRGVDAVTGKTGVLARAQKPSIVGLSIDGRRIAWAESTYKRSRIRAVVLPVG
jgi:Tol biopolymer transport system component